MNAWKRADVGPTLEERAASLLQSMPAMKRNTVLQAGAMMLDGRLHRVVWRKVETRYVHDDAYTDILILAAFPLPMGVTR